jgi:hypothetical protein
VSCPSCGVDGTDGAQRHGALCFDCFLERPFERNIVCNGCGEEKPIVRLYLDHGGFCDDCADKSVGKIGQTGRSISAGDSPGVMEDGDFYGDDRE